jgi:adenine phosphoribosyltransferase
MEWLKSYIRDVPDFPKEGIIFKDITPLLRDPKSFQAVVDSLADKFAREGIDLVLGIEARGFIIAGAVALKLGVGFVPVRKAGKLPCQTRAVEFELEYGTDTLEMHQDAVQPGQRILIIDDLLATGGTAAACCKLVEDAGGEVEALGFVIELSFLQGRQKLQGYRVLSLIQYDQERP